jgi:hypothetical protein
MTFVWVVSTGDPLGSSVARRSGWRLCTTLRLPDVRTGATIAMVGLHVTVIVPLPVAWPVAVKVKVPGPLTVYVTATKTLLTLSRATPGRVAEVGLTLWQVTPPVRPHVKV